jgi:hypothetical protein
MNIAGQRSNVGTDLRFWYGAPGRIRTRDPLLRRHLCWVPGGGLKWPDVGLNCLDGG